MSGIERAYDDARLTGLCLLAVMQAALDDLGRVKRIVKLLGMVNAMLDLGAHPKVMNGCSDLLIDVSGPPRAAPMSQENSASLAWRKEAPP